VNYTLEEAASLIADVNGFDPIVEAEELLAKANNPSEFNVLLTRRVNQHEPVAYITKHAKFRGLDLYIDERVLIPRTETEPLVDIAVSECPSEVSLVDVGAGSGAVSLAVKNERPDIDVLGVDISKDALDVASINSTDLELNVKWKDADLLDGVKGDFYCVLANLPYLPTTKRDSYAPEMVEHEPQVALWGGADGFDLTRRLLALAGPRKGIQCLALEIGLGTETAVCELVRAAGFPTVFATTDSRGDIRAVVGKR
jgi:release factor glutamine methyltransferase